MPPASNALLSTGQDAVDFNRPLSFDTSKVTTMEDMFNVRSARALHPLVALRTLARPAPRTATAHTLAPPSPRAADLACPLFG